MGTPLRRAAPSWPATAALGLALLAGAQDAPAFTAAIAPGVRTLYLQVGAGSLLLLSFNSGGLPANNATVNLVSVSVPATAVGSGTALPMTTDSTVVNSPYDNYPGYCAPATNGEVYVGGFYRAPGNAGAAATLAVQAPANLTNQTGATLSFNEISWVSGGRGDGTVTIPSGRFLATGASRTLLSVSHNQWFESCLAFSYRNALLLPGGTYNGRAVYTLTAP